MKLTLEQLAQATGYSKSTISRVLSGKADEGRIPEKTAEIIRCEAARCGYAAPSINPKKLNSDKARTIGLIVPSISNPYFADIASTIISEARKLGYTTIVADTMEDEVSQHSAIASLLTGKVSGIIIVPCGNDSAALEHISSNYAPIVLVDRYFDNCDLPYVVTNNYKGGYDATMTLIRNGHRDIACIQGPPDTSPNRKRIEGYLSALRDSGIEDKARIVGNEFSISNGYLETSLLLQDRKKMPTAIFALSNTIGLGAIKAIRETGLLIPQDISLISYDNNIYLDHMVPAISRIGQMVDDMGKMAVKLLMENIRGVKRSNSHIELSPEIILRDSVAPLLSVS